jgi:hypothetical protein
VLKSDFPSLHLEKGDMRPLTLELVRAVGGFSEQDETGIPD